MNKVRALLIIAAVVLGILAFGYWHSTTHSTFYVNLNMAGETENEKPTVPGATIQFLDSNGRVLADGVRDKQYGFIHLIHPAYGDCHEVEKLAAFSKEARESWQECFGHQSAWIAKWIGDVANVNVMYGNCLVRNSPVTVSRSSSAWYLWWVPHPHIGGIPYSDYSATIKIDKEDCVENPL